RAAKRILERPAPGRQPRPARRVLGVARETRSEALGHVRLLGLLDPEGGRDRLSGEVVRRAAEPAGDEQVVDLRPLGAHELRDPLDLVGEGRDQRHRDSEPFEPLGEPGSVRVRDVARDELVADRQDRRGAHAATEYDYSRRRRDGMTATDPFSITLTSAP